jgi:hypothetical protein
MFMGNSFAIVSLMITLYSFMLHRSIDDIATQNPNIGFCLPAPDL